MKALAPHLNTRMFQGFTVHVLNNDEVELMMVPELGAKIISLKNLRTQREWLWHPGACLKLFRNQPGDDFSASPLVGMDECLPTICPCKWQGRELPDHGEVWSQPWLVDSAAWQNGVLATSVVLKQSPLAFRRVIELHGNEVRFNYQLSNLSTTEESFVWAIHPLLRLVADDTLELPDSTCQLLGGKTWIDAVDSAIPNGDYAKAFACPVSEGWVAVNNEVHGDRLEFAWDATENNALGLWLTRGGWHGYHHFAVEPSNANDDSLVVAAGRNCCGTVAGRSSVAWQLSLKVGR